MRTFLYSILFMAAITALYPAAAHAQLPGPGNIDWQEVWLHPQPASPDTANPFHWMFGNRSYTGLAYDKWNDVVYVVNPSTCTTGPHQVPCVRVWAIDAETGDIAARIQHSQGLAPQGQLYVDPGVVNGSFSEGQFALYKIDLDDQGRIYAANVVAPAWGLCYPGPPPQCDPAFLAQGPYKIYRWNSPSGNPELIYKTVGTGSTNTEMTWAMWGTSLDVVGKEHTVGGQVYDSARIYASGGKFYAGYVQTNDEINCFIEDRRPTAPTPFRLGLRIRDDVQGSGFAAHGIAATGPSHNSPIWSDANFLDPELNEQVQTSASYPQNYQLGAGLETLPSNVTGPSGPIAYFLDKRFNRPYLIVADGLPSSRQVGQPNNNTTARVVDLSTGPHWQNWPVTKTPQVGNNLYNNLTGTDNWITDVDYKIWINDTPGDSSFGQPYLQVFVLFSNNGIASFRQRFPWKPVELAQFTASVQVSGIVLEWSTASETSNSGFDIERSFNRGEGWERIGFVPGNGTTTEDHSYAFTDPMTENHRNAGIVRYRLKQTDYDGTFEYSPVVEVLAGAAPTGIVLAQNYPNPFSGRTGITYRLDADSYVTLKVYNTLGDEVGTLAAGSKDAGTHRVEFDAARLPAGTYIYRLNVDGEVAEKKMVRMQ